MFPHSPAASSPSPEWHVHAGVYVIVAIVGIAWVVGAASRIRAVQQATAGTETRAHRVATSAATIVATAVSGLEILSRAVLAGLGRAVGAVGAGAVDAAAAGLVADPLADVGAIAAGAAAGELGPWGVAAAVLLGYEAVHEAESVVGGALSELGGAGLRTL